MALLEFLLVLLACWLVLLDGWLAGWLGLLDIWVAGWMDGWLDGWFCLA
jgi:hypothetical protein